MHYSSLDDDDHDDELMNCCPEASSFVACILTVIGMLNAIFLHGYGIVYIKLESHCYSSIFDVVARTLLSPFPRLCLFDRNS